MFFLLLDCVLRRFKTSKYVISRQRTQGKRRGTAKESRDVETTGRGQRQLNLNTTKKGKKQFIFVWSLAYNLSTLSGPTRNMKVPADLACNINETHNPPTTTRCLHVYHRGAYVLMIRKNFVML